MRLLNFSSLYLRLAVPITQNIFTNNVILGRLHEKEIYETVEMSRPKVVRRLQEP